ncbi:nucleotidyltransferase family protein [Devosia rhodophyticola]|uniref:Nucleotidyltransferase family protein n=1 Tax=Devosia rhodophyticola TaxID=3026423 RepID=A0ABY7Z0A1_9HYPH|nr:nucleotidyltransferase family protein [Devosia rhodophyticola]WDR06917.1 nucleotidyltransferase family protein [Devosia rhodophyticola]
MTDTGAFPDVMLLAAGLGTRMRPLTLEQPKPLIGVAGTPLIERIMINARAEGARHFVANAHYLADQLLAHFAGGLRISREEQLLGTGGGVRNALPMLGSDPFFVMNTDAFWPKGSDAPLGRMVAKMADSASDIVLLCVHPVRASGFDRSHDFCLDPRGNITNDYGAPVIYAGVALVRKSLFNDMPDGAFSLTRLFDRALANETLQGVALNAPWYHVGDPEALKTAEAALA